MKIKLTLIFCIFLFLHPSLFAQQKRTSFKFAYGANFGVKTMNGLGLVVAYRPNPLLEFNLGAGFSSYNGGKFGAGGKMMLTKSGFVRPFVSLYYSMTTGKKLTTNSFGNQQETYKTYPNKYIIPNVGIFIPGERLNHYLSMGYTHLLNTYKIDIATGNTTKDNFKEVANHLKGGFMITYTLTFYIQKMDDLE